MPLKEELDRLCKGYTEIYGEGIGLSCAGSAALGGFVPGRSDINLLLELPQGKEPGGKDPEVVLHDVRTLFFRREGDKAVFLESRFLPGSHAFSQEEAEPFAPPQDMNLMLSAFSGLLGMAGPFDPVREEEGEAAFPPLPEEIPSTDPIGDKEILPLWIAQARFAEAALHGTLPGPVPAREVKEAFLHLFNRPGKLPDRVLLTLSALAFLEDGLLLSKKGAGIYAMGKTSDPMERGLLTALVSFCQTREEGTVPEPAEALLNEVRRRVWAAAARFKGDGTC